MRALLISLGLAGGGYLCYGIRWDMLLGMIYFGGFALVALVAFLYRDPSKEDTRSFLDQ